MGGCWFALFNVIHTGPCLIEELDVRTYSSEQLEWAKAAVNTVSLKWSDMRENRENITSIGLATYRDQAHVKGGKENQPNAAETKDSAGANTCGNSCLLKR